MRKLLVFIVCAFCLSTIVFSNYAHAEEDTTKKVTVMIYMCGADLELKSFAGTKTLASINSSGVNKDEINIVALLGGTSSWSRGYDSSKLAILELGSRRPIEIGSMELHSMGDVDTLTNFLDYCHENYPAEKYDLIMWDHGGGPNQGVCFDMLFDNDSLSINELVSALANSSFADKGLDIIAFHTCLTSSIEYAANLASFANYMVATEDSMYGLAYDWLKTLDTDGSSLVTASHIVDGTYELNEEVCKAQSAQEIVSVSAVDLSKVHAVVLAMDDFFKHVIPNTDSSEFIQVSQQRRDSRTFGITESGGSQNRDLADLGDLVFHLRGYAPEEADHLITALQDSVAYKRSAYEDCSGLTVYHPYSNKSALKKYLAVHNDIPLSSEYSAYIQWFSSVLTGTPLAEWSDLHTESAVKKDNRTLFSLALKDEQANNLSYSRLHVLHKQEDGSFRLVFHNPSTSFDGKGLTGEFNGTALYAVENSKVYSAPLSYEVNTNGFYLIPAILTRQGQAGGTDFSVNALICCTLDKETKQLDPGEVLLKDEVVGGYTGIYGLTLEDFSEISVPIISRAETRDDKGVLLPFQEWEEVEQSAWTSSINGDWHFSLLNDTMDTEELYASFQITDAQYNMYSSELAVVKAQANIAGEVRVTYDDMNLARINSFNAAPIGENLVLSVDVTNLSETEAIIVLDHLSLNGENVEAYAEAYGSGDNWGLIQNENQYLQVALPMDELPVTEQLTNITFDLILVDASSDEQIGTVPVAVSLLLSLSI